MKKRWEIKELAAVSAINYGYTESASSKPVGPRFLRITDIQDDCVDWERVPYCKIESADLPKYRLASGDIVFARTGATTGKSFLVDAPPEAVFASYLIRLRLLDKKLLPEFVLLFFQTAGYWQSIKDGSAGSAQGGFNATKLGALTIPVPPLAEQQRIVGILDEAFEGITTAKANAEKNLQNARALFESHLHSVFNCPRKGWGEKLLGEVCEYVNGKAHEQCIDEKGRFIVINSKFISTDGEVFKKSDQALLLLQPGDIAMVLSDVPNGKALAKCYLVEEADTYTLNQRICVIRSVRFHTKFLFYQLNRNRHFLFFDNGENQTNLRLNQVLSCLLFVPALSEQESIAKTLDAMSAETQSLESIYQQKLAALDELKKSLLHQAFNGEL
jgi:type I restriction enzyme S subunit